MRESPPSLPASAFVACGLWLIIFIADYMPPLPQAAVKSAPAPTYEEMERISMESGEPVAMQPIDFAPHSFDMAAWLDP